jgi:hypothetical protein
MVQIMSSGLSHCVALQVDRDVSELHAALNLQLHIDLKMAAAHPSETSVSVHKTTTKTLEVLFVLVHTATN